MIIIIPAASADFITNIMVMGITTHSILTVTGILMIPGIGA